jgi:hypothetical protein
MGSSAAKAHQTFTVSPTNTDAGTNEGVAAWTDGGGHAAFYGLVNGIGNAGDFEDFASLTNTANELLEELTAQGVPAQVISDASGDLKATTKAWLDGLDVGQLQALAAAQGFAHPTLVGLNPEGSGTHPLVHWLDPAYPNDTPSKQKIAAKADERYGALAAGETIAGLNFSDVAAAEAALNSTGDADDSSELFPTWVATAEQIAQLQSEHVEAITGLAQLHAAPGTLHTVLDCENKLVTATCPTIDDTQMAKIKAATVHLTNMAVSAKDQIAVPGLISEHQPVGISAEQVPVATRGEAWAMLRASTSSDQRDLITDTLAKRLDAVTYYTANQTWLTDSIKVGNPTTLTIDGDDSNNIKHFATQAATHIAASQMVRAGQWTHTYGGAWIGAKDTPPVPSINCDEPSLTTIFRAWAKEQPLSHLRAAATSLGLDEASKANRAQVQNYIAATWDSNLNKTAIATQVATPKATPKAAPPAPIPAPAAAAPTPAPAPAPTAATVPGVPAQGWAAKHVAAVAALKHHLGGHQALPQRVAASTVEEWTFGPAKTAALGGGHSKSLHDAPDGSTWLFKPDKSGLGTRAHAEAAASNVFSAVGIPAVPVYAKQIGSHTGSIQPLLPNTVNLGNQSSAWSQADVDAMVRLHVAAWAVSDHDGHGANLLRTSTGGLVPCDQGQAFKFFGTDKLSTGYHPNASFGTQKPVYMQAYAAAKSGDLSPGVTVRPEAALPVIKAFEAMPDDQYRAMLAPVAQSATKNDGQGVTWYPAMRERAAKQHGTTKPTKQQIADAFLHYAIERKRGLRKDFAEFYAAEGFTHKLDLVS